MAAFYGTKIKNEEINPKTGLVWTINDVPKLWKTKVQQWLENNP